MIGPTQARLIAECVFRFYVSLLSPSEAYRELHLLGLTSPVDLSSIDDHTLKAVNTKLRNILRSP